MKLTTAMLADDAFVASNGKLYIHGGAWTRVLSQTFPATHPKMAVVLVLEVDYGEALQNHTVEVVLLKDGEPVGPRVQGMLSVGHPPRTKLGAPAQIPMVFAFQMLTFDTPARYEWEVLAANESVGNIVMEVVPVQLPPKVPSS
ncbi:MAG: hypothetical protein WAL35_00970 [Acidimicrobiales bacterium]